MQLFSMQLLGFWSFKKMQKFHKSSIVKVICNCLEKIDLHIIKLFFFILLKKLRHVGL